MPECASCRHTSPAGAKFCLECGAPFARACPTCGTPAVGKFCMECGTALTGAAAAPAGTAGAVWIAPGGDPTDGPVSERRTTTVLFGDLVSFTSLSEQRDPEEVRELLSEYFAVARTVVGRYGGTIEKFIGDAVMAVWGVPVSHEDDAERAVRAGLDLVAEVAALSASVGAPDLAMRVGVTTGSVAVTLGAVNEGMVAGDAVNTAARVQTAATPNSVWTDQETRGLTAAAVAYSDMGEHTLKGKGEPVRLFRADAIVAAVGGAQRVDGLEAPLTGRDAEMRRVKEIFHATQTDGKPRVVLVSGMPGLGKSRLGWEFEKYADGLSDEIRWHRGRSLSYGDGVAFWAFAEMIRSRVGLLESEDKADIRARVREGVSAIAKDAAEADWLASRVDALLGAWDGAAFDKSDLFTAWTTLLDRVSGDERLPVVLLFEDMQYADSGLLELVEHLLETTRAPLYVLALTRPELLEQRPSLAAGRRATVISLDALPDDAMTVLVDGLVADLPEHARTAIVDRSDGVPLYAVETVRSLIDRDAVVARDGRYVFVDHDHSLVDLAQLAAPTSLQTLIASRLDALSPLERRTVQDASVLGLSFRQASLMDLNDVGEYELSQALDGLVRKGVIEAQNDPRSPERGQFRFLQALVREVAYSTLARKDRRARHLAAADHLQNQSLDSVESMIGIIAQHLVDAVAATTDHDPDRPGLAARARWLLAGTADRAEALGSGREALAASLTALALDPDDDIETADLQARAARAAAMCGENEQGAELAEAAFATYRRSERHDDAAGVCVTRSSLAINLGRNADAAGMARQGLDLADPGALSLRSALMLRLLTAIRLRPVEEKWPIALELGRLAEASEDPATQVGSLNSTATLLSYSGSSTASRALVERSVAIAREHHMVGELGRSLMNLTADLYPVDLERALETAEEAIAVTQQAGDSFYALFALIYAANCWLVAGEHDRMTTALDDWFDGRRPLSAEGHLLMIESAARRERGERLRVRDGIPDSDDLFDQRGTEVYRALLQEDSGDLVGAAQAAAASLRANLAEDEGIDDVLEVWAVVTDLQVRAGDLEEAEGLVELFAPRIAAAPAPLVLAEHARLRGTITAARDGDAEADLREAITRHEAFGSSYRAARSRLELGTWLLRRARADEAASLLAEARDAFTRLGARPSLAELDGLTGRVSVG